MATMELTKANFDEVLDKNDTVVLDFWAEWCGPCVNFASVYEECSEKFPSVIFGKIDTENEPELAGEFHIRSIPTLMVIRQNIVVFSGSGSMPLSALTDLVTQAQLLDMDDVRRSIENDVADDS